MADSPPGTRIAAGVASAGAAGAVVAFGVTQLVSALVSPASDARAAVGAAIIDLTPGSVKEWAIQTFGTADKLFLSVMVLAVVIAVAAMAATRERSRVPLGTVTLLVFGGAGCAAVLARPGAGLLDAVPTLVGTGCGVAVLRFLTASAPDGGTADTDTGRRRSLQTLAFLGLGTATGVGGVLTSRRLQSVATEIETAGLPPVARPAPPIPPGVQPPLAGLPSFVTGNADFFRIDTALRVPQLSRRDWTLRIHGMVGREITYTFGDLQRFEPVQRAITLTCVSNPIGGDLISNAVWTGYRIRDLLRDAAIADDADMVLSTSVDGFTVGTPVEALTDDRDALLAIGMNGVPLPPEHGYPARLVVPGLYGFVSATKWVVDLELTRFDRAEAYWTRLGWSAQAPIKTGSRIDVPRAGARLKAGPVTLGGVAWAQGRGIGAVEVRIDDAEWRPATLGAAYSHDTWRLWTFDWQATPGPHTITVRATDNTGTVQTADRSSPIPDGATGWPSITVDVR
ncbi:MAG TPA: molybdopterin-dependent oxidoreductase [Mycobacterium sp.]|nr:molybdopterin-dependent oxidoreductase [Mycobacterium sp.]